MLLMFWGSEVEGVFKLGGAQNWILPIWSQNTIPVPVEGRGRFFLGLLWRFAVTPAGVGFVFLDWVPVVSLRSTIGYVLVIPPGSLVCLRNVWQQKSI